MQWTVCCGFGVNNCALVRTHVARDLRGTRVKKSKVRDGGIRGGIWWFSQLWDVLLSSFLFLLSLPLCSLIFLFTCYLSKLSAMNCPTSQLNVSMCILQVFLSSPACCVPLWTPQQHLQADCALGPVSHSDTFLLFLSSELQLCIFWKSQIFPLGLGFNWLYLRFAGFYPLSECLSCLYIWSLDPANYP